MRSILDKALAALLEGKQEDADKLFHDFVLERARQVNESIVETGEADVDAIVESASVEALEKKVAKLSKEYADCDDFATARHEIKQDLDKAREELAAAKKNLKEGKTFKRGEDDETDVDAKKKEDKQKRDDRKKPVDESEEVVEGKTFKRGKDDEADDKKKEDQQRKDAAKKKRDQVAEGKLEIDQDEDGTLHMTHHVASSVDALAVPPAPIASPAAVAPMAEPMPAVAPVVPSMEPSMDDMGSDPMGDGMGLGDEMDDISMDSPMPGVEDLADDSAFESLKESLADELEKIIVSNKDHMYADGKKATSNDHSPVPNVDAADRFEQATPATTKQDEHNGFDREPTPATKKQEMRTNVRNGADKGTEKVSKEGDGKALLNQIGDDKTAKSPISGKK